MARTLPAWNRGPCIAQSSRSSYFGAVGFGIFTAMRPARSRYTPGAPNPSHFGGTPRSSWPPSITSPTVHYLYYRLAPKPSAVCLNMPSCTRAPAGCPRSVANRKKRRFASSLSAHLRRQVQPHHRLISRTLHDRSTPSTELGERLKFTSHISAEGAARDSALSGSQPNEETPQGRVDQT